MLTLMKQKRFRRYAKIVFGVVAFVFIIGFALDVSNVGQQKDALTAANVNGTAISTLELSRIYRQQVQERYQQLTPEQRKQLNLPKQVLEEVIQSHLLLQEAPRLGFRVGAEELRETIQGRSYFQEAGKFSMERYRRILKQSQTSPAQFEQSERDNLLLEKSQDLVTALIYIPADQVDHAALSSGVQVNVEVLEIDEESLGKTLKPSKEELKSFFESKPDAYKTEERRTVEYVEYPSQDAVQEAAALLEANKDLRSVAEQQKWVVKETGPVVRHGKVEGFDDPEILLAQGFLLSKGEIGPPLETGGKHYLIRVTEVEAPKPAAFEDVAEKVKQGWILDRAAGFAKERAEEILKAAGEKKSASLKKHKAGKGADTVFETGLFSLDADSIPKVGTSKEFKRVAFSLSSDSRFPAAPVHVGRKWYVVRLIEIKLPAADEWPKKRIEVRDDLARLKRFEAATAWRDQLKKNAKIDINDQALESLL